MRVTCVHTLACTRALQTQHAHAAATHSRTSREQQDAQNQYVHARSHARVLACNHALHARHMCAHTRVHARSHTHLRNDHKVHVVDHVHIDAGVIGSLYT